MCNKSDWLTIPEMKILRMLKKSEPVTVRVIGADQERDLLKKRGLVTRLVQLTGVEILPSKYVINAK